MDCDMEPTYTHVKDHSIIGPGSTEEWRRFLQKNLVDTIQYGSEAVTHNVLSGGSGDVAGKTAPSRHNPFVDKLVSDIVANNASCKTAIERICDLSVDKKDKERYHDMVVVQQRDTDAELREAWSGSGASEPTHARFEPRLRGDGLTGTALFFATEVLAAYVNKQSVSRDTHHDLESFCWVIVYAIYKNSIDRVDISLQSQPDAQLKDLRNQLYQECKLIFGSITPSDLFNQRKLVLEFPPGEDEEDESIYRYVWKLHVFLEEDAAGDKMPLVAILRWAWVALKTRPRQPREESASGKRDTRQKLRLHQKEVLRDFKPDSTKSALGTLTHAMFIKGINNALEV